MLNCPISVHRDQHVFGDPRSSSGSPLDHCHRHGLLNSSVKHVALLASEHIIYSNGSVVTGCSNVLIVRIVLDTEGLIRSVSQIILMAHFHSWVLSLLDLMVV